jgi:hypothetical protein
MERKVVFTFRWGLRPYVYEWCMFFIVGFSIAFTHLPPSPHSSALPQGGEFF